MMLDERDELARRLAACEQELRQTQALLSREAAASTPEWRRVEADLRQAQQALAQTNAQLERSQGLLRLLFDGLDDGFLLLDGAGSILALNRALARLFSLDADAAVGRHWSDLTSQPGFDAIGMIVVQTLFDGRPRRRRETCALQNGRHIAVDLQSLTLTNAGGQVENVILQVIDVTERLQLETFELQHDRFAASARLVATIAHELNTPLLSIQSCLYLAEQSDASRMTYLGLAREEIERIGGVLRQLLDLHRPDAGARSRVAINALVERVLLLTGGTLHEHHLVVDRQLSKEELYVLGYPGQLTQVLLNLIFNAADAMPKGGRLTLRTASGDQPLEGLYSLDSLPDGERVLIEVGDTGLGVAPDIRDSIFKPFFTTRPMGTGLGLAISRQIVRRHGGAIGLVSAPGEGSTFTVALPPARAGQSD